MLFNYKWWKIERFITRIKIFRIVILNLNRSIGWTMLYIIFESSRCRLYIVNYILFSELFPFLIILRHINGKVIKQTIKLTYTFIKIKWITLVNITSKPLPLLLRLFIILPSSKKTWYFDEQWNFMKKIAISDLFFAKISFFHIFKRKWFLFNFARFKL